MKIQKLINIIFPSLLCLSVILSFVSCSQSPSDTAPATDAEATHSTENSPTLPAVTTVTSEDTVTDAVTTEVNLDSLVPAQKDLYVRYTDEQPHEAISADLKELGCRFTVLPGCYLTGLYFEALPTWSTNDYSCFTVQLYAWKTDYQTSVSYEPLISAEYTGWADNAPCDIDFTKISYDGFNGFSAGEYLYVFVGNTDMIGVWSMGPSDECMYFNDGAECENGYRVIANLLIPKA